MDNYKSCIDCKKIKSDYEFDWRSDRNCRRTQCKHCRILAQKRRYKTYKENSPSTKNNGTKARCIQKNLICDIDSEYLESIFSGICPITGEKLN
jgi:hypothetical protein